MTWTIRTDREFDRALRKLDRQVAARVLKALTSLEDLEDPVARCKALSGPYTGLWRLRMGDYRVILDIRRGELVIIALGVGNRSSIYDCPGQVHGQDPLATRSTRRANREVVPCALPSSSPTRSDGYCATR